jgi:hypothetical protein
MTMVLRWRTPERAIATRWRGPEGLAQAVARDPAYPIAAIIGPAGPAGPAGASVVPLRLNATNSATWILNHSLGRIPTVQVFIGSGEQVLADVDASATTITVTHASPQSGFVLAY